MFGACEGQHLLHMQQEVFLSDIPSPGVKSSSSHQLSPRSSSVLPACWVAQARCCAVLLPCVQFVGASHMVVSGSHDGTARVWDPWSGDCAAVLEGHSGRLNAVVTSSDGTTIITCSDDNTARVWEGSSYKLIRCVMTSEGLRPLLMYCLCAAAAVPPAKLFVVACLLWRLRLVWCEASMQSSTCVSWGRANFVTARSD